MSQTVLTETRKQRVKLINVSVDLILGLLKIDPANNLGLSFVDDPIPSTAKALRAGISGYGDVQLVIEDASFNEVEEGQVIPSLHPMCMIDEVRRGWRSFVCECGLKWAEPTRDRLSPSGESCPKCNETCHPDRCWPDPELEVDQFANLV